MTATLVPPGVPTVWPLWPYGDASLALVLGGGLAALLALAIGLRRAGMSAQGTRTLVHAGTALAVAAIPWLFAAPLAPILLAAAFAAVNLWAVRRQRLDALHLARPDSYGTVAMPLALVLLGAWTLAASVWGSYGTGPLLVYHDARLQWSLAWTVLALADPFAGWIGRRYGAGGAKSWAGSGAFFALTFALVAGMYAAWKTACPTPSALGNACYADALRGAHVSPLALGLAAAAVGTACEWLGRKGWDNLTVVLGVFFATSVLGRWDGWTAVLPVAVAAAFAYASFRARLLSGSGAVAAGLFAWLVLEIGSWAYVLSGVGFFLLSSLLSRWRRRRSATAEAIAEKGHRRDAWQVAANGFVGAAALAGVLPVLLGRIGVGTEAWPLWLGAFAAATADTWGTEIGTRFGGTPRLVTSGRKVPPGASGGVSLAGLLGGLSGAAVVGGLFALGSAMAPWGSAEGRSDVPVAAGRALAVALAAGLAGTLFDSLLGATVQRRFRRPDGTLTEKRTADGVPNEPAGGWAWMTNDTVNFLATLAGALVGAAVFVALAGAR